MVSGPKSTSPSPILNSLAESPDIAERVFGYISDPRDLLRLHYAIKDLRQSGRLGRLLPGLRELQFLGLNSWIVKVKLLPPTLEFTSNTDKPTDSAIRYMHLPPVIPDPTYALLKRLVRANSARSPDLGEKMMRVLTVARLGDELLERFRFLQRTRKRHEIEDSGERARLMAEECAMSDAVGERIDMIRNGEGSACVLCFDQVGYYPFDEDSKDPVYGDNTRICMNCHLHERTDLRRADEYGWGY